MFVPESSTSVVPCEAATPPENAIITVTGMTAHVTCVDNYHFPNGSYSIDIECLIGGGLKTQPPACHRCK